VGQCRPKTDQLVKVAGMTGRIKPQVHNFTNVFVYRWHKKDKLLSQKIVEFQKIHLWKMMFEVAQNENFSRHKN